MQKKYKLKRWYPSLPKDWEVGMEVGQGDRYDGLYSPCSGKYSDVRIITSHVEKNSDYWQEVKEIKLDVPIGTKFKIYPKNFIYTIDSVGDGREVTIKYVNQTYTYSVEEVNERFKYGDWTIYKEKEYEILHTELNDKILSIKRLSDNVIFQLGDKVTNPNCKSQTFVITEFYMDCNNEHLLCGTGHINITKIEHYKEPILITEDGKELFIGDTYWTVHEEEGKLLVNKAVVNNGLYFINFKRFSTEELAQKYIDNKPLYSKQQYETLLDDKRWLEAHILKFCAQNPEFMNYFKVTSTRYGKV